MHGESHNQVRVAGAAEYPAITIGSNNGSPSFSGRSSITACMIWVYSVMDERQENDGEPLLLPIVIAGQVYPVEYKKSPLAVQAMHRA